MSLCFSIKTELTWSPGWCWFGGLPEAGGIPKPVVLERYCFFFLTGVAVASGGLRIGIRLRATSSSTDCAIGKRLAPDISLTGGVGNQSSVRYLPTWRRISIHASTPMPVMSRHSWTTIANSTLACLPAAVRIVRPCSLTLHSLLPFWKYFDLISTEYHSLTEVREV